MAEDLDQPSELPTSERVASVRSQLKKLRERLEELQRLAPQPPPPLPPSPPPNEVTVGTPAHDGGGAGAPPDEHQPMTGDVAKSAAAPIASDASAKVALPAAPVMDAVTPSSWPPARRARNNFQLALNLAQRPGFCCCCLCLGPRDAKRARRIFALVRAIKRSEMAERRHRR